MQWVFVKDVKGNNNAKRVANGYRKQGYDVLIRRVSNELFSKKITKGRYAVWRSKEVVRQVDKGE